MSEPMTVVEIEDVLSSIRRLVSEDLRPTHKLVSAVLQNGASKLILTPALRVVTYEHASRPPEPNSSFDAPEDMHSADQASVTLDVVSPAQIMPLFGSVRNHDLAERHAPAVQGSPEHTGNEADFLTSAMSRINGISTAEHGPVLVPAESIEAVVAAVGAAVGPDEWELDGGEPAQQDVAWASAAWQRSDPDTIVRAQAPLVLSDAMSVANDQGAATVETGRDAAASDPEDGSDTGGEIEHLPTAAAETYLAGQDTIVFQDGNLPQGADLQDTEAADGDDITGFLNEDMLRDIVRDMIHDELQGTLGERITRNVRKLVRAEINRALASRDFE
jgi:hypothetical protein